MKVKELIEELQRVDKEVEVTITTREGTRGIERVVSSGWSGPITILTD